MLDLSVIILTYNEERHIKRCLDNISYLARKVYIIDSYSTDNTLKIAASYENVVILQNKWENNHAKQFNWALENANITTEWILRLDADEYLLPELQEELKLKLNSIENNTNGIVFKRRHYFMDKWMKRGIYPVKLLRLFRRDRAICEQRLMDEHIQLLDGVSVEFDNDFVDHNLNNLSWFCNKHIGYAVREAIELLDVEYNLSGREDTANNLLSSKQAQDKRNMKYKYAKQPLFLRSFAYFFYRYIVKGACLDGKIGFIWTFMQAWWYRTLVDANIFDIKRKCAGDKGKMRKYIYNEYNIKL